MERAPMSTTAQAGQKPEACRASERLEDVRQLGRGGTAHTVSMQDTLTIVYSSGILKTSTTVYV
jgi:hypothetical protein